MEKEVLCNSKLCFLKENSCNDLNNSYIKRNIRIEVTKKQIFISLPKNDTDSQFLRSFKYFGWNKSKFCWVVPNWKKNLKLIKSYFKDRIKEFRIIKTEAIQNGDSRYSYSINQFLVVNNKGKQLKIFFYYQKDLVRKIRELLFSKWDSLERCWILPFSDSFVKELRSISCDAGLEFVYKNEECIPEG